ncbi:MAG: glycosyltransferase family 4 protein [Isosphaeraceae bacterium]
MNVLHAYSGNMFGGVETMLITLARQQRASLGVGHQFALCHEGRLAEELRAAGAQVHALDPARFSRPWTVLKARQRFRRLLANRRPDVIICHGCWSHDVFAPVARREGLPLVFWAHDTPEGTHWVERLAMRTPPDLALVNSQFTAGRLDRLFPGVPHEVCFYPVAPQGEVGALTRVQTRRDLGTANGSVVVIQVSRLERWKGHAVLIDALGRLRDRPGWTAWIAGGAQRPSEALYLDELRAAARHAGIADRVRFLGQRTDVPRLLAAADLFCQPNTGPEPFGIVFVEALYAGLPVVTTDLGGAVEIVNDACGVVVQSGDPAALAGALASLIDNPETRARLGETGPARARDLCDPEMVWNRLHDLLAKWITAKTGVCS